MISRKRGQFFLGLVAAMAWDSEQRVRFLVEQCRKRGRMSLHAFLRIKTSPPCLPKRCPVVARRLLAGLQRDDVQVGAGDGTRTRDSLLGRQAVALSPLACYTSALQPVSYGTHAL